MRSSKEKLIEKLSDIESDISMRETDLSKCIKLLKDTAMIRKELEKNIFKKEGKVKILKEDLNGSLKLYDFEED